MPTLLKDLSIEEISSVDKGANPGARVLLTKRDSKKGNQPMSSTIILKNAAFVVEHNGPPAFSKADFIRELYKRADEIRADGETVAKARTRAMTEDKQGALLWKASRHASGPEIEGDAVQDQAPKAKPLGPAGRKMQAMADAHLKAHPELAERRGVTDGGKAAAYASVFTHPKNADLRAAVNNEHMQAALRGPEAAQDDEEDSQDESNRFADAQAAKYPANRDIEGPNPRYTKADSRARLIGVIDRALAELIS